jgi:hypothetical protein
VSFAGRYYTAGRALTGHVVQVRCVNGVVQLILDGDLVRAWQQRHTPEQEQRLFQHPTHSSAPPTPGHPPALSSINRTDFVPNQPDLE